MTASCVSCGKTSELTRIKDVCFCEKCLQLAKEQLARGELIQTENERQGIL